ncbi:putative integrase [Mycolicibacterium novocastrense]|uniref:Integrase n=1 Tax=Mycolicibacterium novocastrense TaxID=59813 RepID=A0ABQ0KGZ0_MYCNV|nr:putative integrase [Mycolicibacterium novocastrense]
MQKGMEKGMVKGMVGDYRRPTWEHSVHKRGSSPRTLPTASASLSSVRTASGDARRCARLP